MWNFMLQSQSKKGQRMSHKLHFHSLDILQKLVKLQRGHMGISTDMREQTEEHGEGVVPDTAEDIQLRCEVLV